MLANGKLKEENPMKYLSWLLVVIALVACTLLVASNRARLGQTSAATQPASAQKNNCGCTTACMGGKQCAISCPQGQAAHCECEDRGPANPKEPKCYCR